MKNKSIDLNNHLFEQLERLNDEELKGEDLKEEIERSKAIADISKQIIENNQLVLESQKFIAKHQSLDIITVPEFLQLNKGPDDFE